MKDLKEELGGDHPLALSEGAAAYVYLLVDGDGLADFISADLPAEGAFGHCKVGVSGDPSARLKQIQTGNPKALTLLGIVPFDTVAEAKKVEAAMHRRFAPQASGGGSEWFRFSRDVAWAIFDMRAAWYPRARIGIAMGVMEASQSPPDSITLAGMITPEHFEAALHSGLFVSGQPSGSGTNDLFVTEVVVTDDDEKHVLVRSNPSLFDG